jgi:hypothetical protein
MQSIVLDFPARFLEIHHITMFNIVFKTFHDVLSAVHGVLGGDRSAAVSGNRRTTSACLSRKKQKTDLHDTFRCLESQKHIDRLPDRSCYCYIRGNLQISLASTINPVQIIATISYHHTS